ncbi:17546_t:CDS:2 [Entrophospora sp. SA101]|nr:17546_t:CDS:2 [Entrophospora sp. SA101]
MADDWLMCLCGKNAIGKGIKISIALLYSLFDRDGKNKEMDYRGLESSGQYLPSISFSRQIFNALNRGVNKLKWWTYRLTLPLRQKNLLWIHWKLIQLQTKLIHDTNRSIPQYKGLVHGVSLIVAKEGIGGIYRGLFPVMMRQGANQAVRFSVYSTLKQRFQKYSTPGQPLPWSVTFLMGAIAGIITVYSTMPLDVVKTRMQGLDATSLYQNSFHCAWKVLKEEGVFAFWKGVTPRLGRLLVTPTYIGDFHLPGKELRKNGLNRIGNLVVPNDNYCKFEDWVTPILDKLLEEQKSKIIHRLGKEINNPDSIYYWAYKNDIPVYCPALTDGSLGDMIYFHSFKNPGLIIDIASDIRSLNDQAVFAKKTGMIILGGGVIKHHICNANLMRNGADYSVYINTGQEFDGSDAGARPDEAVSWGKISVDAEHVKMQQLYFL